MKSCTVDTVQVASSPGPFLAFNVACKNERAWRTGSLRKAKTLLLGLKYLSLHAKMLCATCLNVCTCTSHLFLVVHTMQVNSVFLAKCMGISHFSLPYFILLLCVPLVVIIMYVAHVKLILGPSIFCVQHLNWEDPRNETKCMDVHI